MTYREALAWIYSFSDTERTGVFVRDREDNLRRERMLLEALGNPHLSYGVTHVAGTKGKGSTSAMIAAILGAAGVRTGLYTQPDLHTFRERIRVGNTLISEHELTDLVPELQGALARIGDRLGPYITYEVATALAFLYFQRAGVEHVVIEVGLGGRLDATNVVEPAVVVITSISYDHMQVLGNTLSEISREKAGIIKRGVPTVCSAQAPEALRVIRDRCAALDSRLVTVGTNGADAVSYVYRPGSATPYAQTFDLVGPRATFTGLELGLLGEHQLENAAAAIAAIAELNAVAGMNISESAIREGLRGVRWPARLQVVGERPWLVVDGAHNGDSVERLLVALRRHITFDGLVLVLGLMADKDLSRIAHAVVDAYPRVVEVTAARSARAMEPARIAGAIGELDPTVMVSTEPDVGAALAGALNVAKANDLVCVTGSLYLAGEALRWIAEHDGSARMYPVEIAGVDH